MRPTADDTRASAPAAFCVIGSFVALPDLSNAGTDHEKVLVPSHVPQFGDTAFFAGFLIAAAPDAVPSRMPTPRRADEHEPTPSETGRQGAATSDDDAA